MYALSVRLPSLSLDYPRGYIGPLERPFWSLYFTI